MLASRVLRQRCLARPFTIATDFTPLSSTSTSTSLFTRPRFFSNTSARLNIHSEEIHRRLQAARPLVSDRAGERFQNVGRSRSSKFFVGGCIVAGVIFYFLNTQTVPVTGRRRFNILSDEILNYLGYLSAEGAVNDIEAQGGRFLTENDRRVLVVKKVMDRLIPVSGIADKQWDIKVIDDERTYSPTHCSTDSC